MSTFSIGFEEQSFDELELARLVAKRYGTDHHELVLRPDAVDLLPRLVDAFDEPFGDSSALPTYLVSQLASDTVKVVLSGEGGDELFGGYYTYVADRLAPAGRSRRAVPAAAGRAAAELLGQGELRLQGQALRPRRPLAARRAPPRLEGDLLRRTPRTSCSAPPRTTDPLDVYRARYGETEGGAGAGAPAGPRPRHLSGRRPAGEDRPGEHGPLARGPRALPRPGGRRACPGAGDEAEGPRLLQEAAAAPGRGAAPSEGDHPRAASRGSRSRSRPGSGGISSPSPATFSRRRPSSGRATSTRSPSPAYSTTTSPARRT